MEDTDFRAEIAQLIDRLEDKVLAAQYRLDLKHARSDSALEEIYEELEVQVNEDA